MIVLFVRLKQDMLLIRLFTVRLKHLHLHHHVKHLYLIADLARNALNICGWEYLYMKY